MKISVVIPNFDDNRIGRAIKSIAGQENCEKELIVVDGGSTRKDVRNVYHECSSFIDLLISEPDKGIFDALNKGIKAANGDLVFLMGADDQLSDSSVFMDVVTILRCKDKADGICIGCVFTTASGRVVRRWFPRSVSSRNIRWGLIPPHFSLFLKRELYDKVGLFDISYSLNDAIDTIWLMRMAVLHNVNIPVIRNHYTNMGYGGYSTGSVRNVLKACRIIAMAARRNGIKQWWLTPLVKVASKVVQFRL